MAEIYWLEVSMTVDPELAEAVADVIGRFIPKGVVMEQAVTYNDAEDLGTPYGPVRVYGYLAMDSKTRTETPAPGRGAVASVPDSPAARG